MSFLFLTINHLGLPVSRFGKCGYKSPDVKTRGVGWGGRVWAAESVWHTEMLIRPLFQDVEGAGFWDRLVWVLSKVAKLFTSARRAAKETALDQCPGRGVGN